MSDTADRIGPAKLLLSAVYEYLDEHYPHWRVSPGTLPDGLRVEMHPSVHQLIISDTDTFAWAPTTEALSKAFEVPVRVTTWMPEGHWRLVIVTENALTGGKLDQPATATP